MTTTAHEISHMALADLPGGKKAPRWFKEGLAVAQSEGFAMDRLWSLTEAATMGRLIPIGQLEEGFPAAGHRAGLAYAQSVHFVGYVRSRFGEEAFREILGLLGDTNGRIDKAVLRVVGISSDELSEEWHDALRVRWGWLPVVFGTTSLWVFCAFLVVLGWRRRRRIASAKLALMRLEEARESSLDLEISEDTRGAKGKLDPYDGRPPTYH
jgi:hypothetical protein